MRILIISDAWHPQVNGVVRTYECVVRELERLGHTIQVISPADFSFTLPLPGYAEIRLPVTPYKKLKQMIAAFKPDSIHIATEGPLGWAGRRWCIRHAMPFSTSYHTHFADYVADRAGRYGRLLKEPSRAIGKFFVRRFHKPADIILVATPTLQRTLKEWQFKNTTHLFSRGVDTSIFYPGPKKLFQDLPRPIALYVGRIAIEKNLGDFLRMDWQGSKIIVGEGPMLEELTVRHPSVIFAGKKYGEELADYYRSADIFVFPSRTDTFGIVLVEALACGLPVAGYQVMGPQDIVNHASLGALHSHDLGAAARAALQQGDAETRAAHVRRYYSWAHAAGQFEEALRQTLRAS